MKHVRLRAGRWLNYIWYCTENHWIFTCDWIMWLYFLRLTTGLVPFCTYCSFLRDSCIIYLGNFYNSRHVFMNLSTIVHVASLPKKFRRCEYAFNGGFCDLVFQRKITPRCDLPKLADVLFPYPQAMEDQIITEFENSTFPGEIGD